MSIKITKATINVEDFLQLIEVSDSLEDKLKFYSKNHPDFSCVIENHIDSNKVIVKTLYLEEHVN